MAKLQENNGRKNDLVTQVVCFTDARFRDAIIVFRGMSYAHTIRTLPFHGPTVKSSYIRQSLDYFPSEINASVVTAPTEAENYTVHKTRWH